MAQRKTELMKFDEFIIESKSKFMYHTTKKENVEKILSEGLKINMPVDMTQGGVWSHKIYGMNPIFLSSYPAKTENMIMSGDEFKDYITLKVNVTGLDLVSDLPSLITHGAYMDYDGGDVNCLYWYVPDEYKAKELKEYLNDDGEIYFDDLLYNPDVIKASIELTGSAVVMENIPPERISKL